MLNTYLFIYNPSSETHIIKQFGVPKDVVSLKLLGYSFSGVPTTNGHPDQLFYSLILPQFGNRTDRTDNKRGIPLLLTGTETRVWLSQPLEVNLKSALLHNFEVEIEGENFQPAIFSKCAFWFIVTQQPPSNF